MYVQFMKNFLLTDSSKLISVRLNFAQKRLNPTSRHDVRLVHEKFSSRRFEQAHGLDSFRPNVPKNV